MKCHKSTLSSGLRILTIPMPSLESATVTIWAGVGSRYENKKLNGISHFLEHIVFKGGQKYNTAKKVSEAIDSFGGEFNASTGKEITNFYIKARVDYLDKAFDVLSDIVLRPLLKPADIEREKGVIKAEIDMYNDLPMRKVEENYENLIYSGNSLGWDVIGTKKTIDTISQKDFQSYLKTHYHTKNIAITVAGGVTPNKVEKLVKKYFASLPKSTKSKSEKFTTKQKKPAINLTFKKTDQAHFIIGYLGDRLGHKNRYAEAVLATVLGGGMSSRIFTEVREKRGLAYAVKTYADHYTDTGCFTTYAGVTPAKAIDAMRVILKQYSMMNSVDDCKVTNRELKKAKEYLKGHLALSLEDTSAVNSFFAMEEILLGKTRTIEEVYKGIDAVKTEDLVKVAKEFFQPHRLNLAVIGPYKSQERFKKILYTNL